MDFKFIFSASIPLHTFESVQEWTLNTVNNVDFTESIPRQ